jgi:antagonist of KipI
MTLRVLEPGLHTLVVDFGRPGSRSLGVPVGGAADRWALALGNALVANPPAAAALEITWSGPTVVADCELACVVCGAPFELYTDRRRLTAGTTFTLYSGEELHIASTHTRMRAYLCVRAGFQEKLVLGSRSALEPVRAGDVLACQTGRIGGRFVRPLARWNQEPRTLRVVDGRQASWFNRREIFAHEFAVTPASNRMGLRLEGPSLTGPARELVSEPVCPGSVQVTHDGRCIILGVDGQTIGGYPKIAQVITADLDKLGQLRPGDRLTFLRVSLQEAERAYRQKQAELREWLDRLIFPFRD